LGVIAYWAVVSQREPDAASDEADRSFARTARVYLGAPVRSVAFSPGDSHMASSTIEGDVWLKDLTTGRSLRLKHGPIVAVVDSMEFSPDGRVLAAASTEPKVRLWDVRSGTELAPIEGDRIARRIAFSRSGGLLAVGEEGGARGGNAVTLWNWVNRRRLAVLDCSREGINDLRFSPDGTALAIAGQTTGLVTLWDVATGRERATLQAQEPRAGGVVALAFSPDGALLATAGFESAVQLWDVASGELRSKRTGAHFAASKLAFSPDGKLLAIVQGDGTATLWAVEAGRPPGHERAWGERIQSIAFSGDGRLLATGAMDGSVCLWDVERTLGGESPAGP
jgi:WD40 repeat protein